MKNTLYYVHDPMCSWCWGFAPALDEVTELLDDSIKVKRLLGGLAPDNENPMPAAMQTMLQGTWQRISAVIPGTKFNFDFWTECQPKRSTWPSCRAVIAARSQEPDLEVPMIKAIQEAYYLDAKNPSETTTLVALATGIGCQVSQFETDLHSEATRKQLTSEIAFSLSLGVQGFPSLVFANTENQHFPITVDYSQPGKMLDRIEQLSIG